LPRSFGALTMKPTITPTHATPVPPRRGSSPRLPGVPGRQGMSLLEVLVSLGILVAGLASVAALLPASGARLAEASAADRSGALSMNVQAHLLNRRELEANWFTGGVKTVVLGSMFPNTPFNSAPYSKRQAPQPPGSAASYGTLAYGAVITPVGSSEKIEPGMPARMAVAIFKKGDPESRRLALESVGSGVFKLATSGQVGEDERKKFLPGCTWVLAVNEGSGGPPRWLHVASSWSTRQAGGTTPADSFVSFSAPERAAELASGSTLVIYGFNGVLRVDERIIVLE